MSTSAVYSLFCDECGNWVGEELSRQSARRNGKVHGYRRARTPDGVMQDFCPPCYEEHIEKPQRGKP